MNNKKYMNKKADITVTVLTIGIIAVCFFALLSFYISDLNTSKNFEGISLIEKVYVRAEKAESLDNCTPGTKNCYKEELLLKYWRPWKDDKLLFKVEYYP